MKQIRSILLLVGLSVCSNSFSQSDTLSFLKITDSHLIFNLEFFAPEIANARKHYGNGVEPLKEFLGNIPDKTKSDMVLITGDLIDFYQGELTDDNFLAYQVEQVINLINKANIPVYYVLGNHDIATYYKKNDKAEAHQAEATEARAVWIRNSPLFAKGTWYSRLFEVSGTRFRLIFLDNAYNEGESGLDRQPYIGKEQYRWLKEQIEQEPDDVEIIVAHIPFSKNYAGDPLFSLLSQYTSVKLILAGHEHMNELTSFKEGAFTQVQTGAFGRDTENWRLIRLTKDQIIISNAGNTQTEQTIFIK